ncbi:hypothetical protein PF005_g7853 [Phytophthora fragariae]|uniref:Uncharacterized protein n=1 Tax=Phytophthora fragariae TaxID=53985 RepID=A0A6A3YI71_9STRA|nr:hypothetical protein PF005_g7853 [Phytophthora fragariae]
MVSARSRGWILDCRCPEQPLMALNDGVESSSAVEPLQMLQHSGRATRVDAVLCFQSEAIGEEQLHEGDEELGLRPLLLQRPYLPTDSCAYQAALDCRSSSPQTCPYELLAGWSSR